MDDVGEIQSPASSSPSNGRISGRVDDDAADAAAVLALSPPSSPQKPTPATSNALARPKNTAGGVGGGGREDCWSEGATAVLIEAWGERYVELSRGNLKQNHWKEVADIVGSREGWAKPAKTDVQCKNRIDTVKKKYKSERAKIAAGNGPSKWRFYNRLEQLIGSNPKTAIATATATKPKALLSQSAPPGRSIRIAVPTGIPVGSRSGPQYQFGKPHMKGGSGNSKSNSSQKLKMEYRKRGAAVIRNFSSEDEEEEDEEEEEEEEVAYPDSDDSLPPEKKKRRVAAAGMKHQQQQNGMGKEKKETWGSSIRMLTASVLKLGQAYEQAENAKLQQVLEMEKTRMKFAKELELQRMQFFMKTQMEISQLKRRRGPAGGGDRGGGEGGIGFVAAAAAAIAATSNHHDDGNQSHQSHDDYDHHSDGGKPVRADTINSDSDN